MDKPETLGHLPYLPVIADEDAKITTITDTEYHASWKQRGGAGAFFVLARKWDRLENAVKRNGWDILAAAAQDSRAEGVLDDLRDLRRYLLLVEAELRRAMVAMRQLTPRDQEALNTYAVQEAARQELRSPGPQGARFLERRTGKRDRRTAWGSLQETMMEKHWIIRAKTPRRVVDREDT